MIARVRGILDEVQGQVALVRADGVVAGGLEVTLEVMIPAYLAVELAGSVGKPVTFWTLAYMDSPNQGASFVPRLIGFSSQRERAFFELFTTVKGIGNRRALRALAEKPGRIASAVMRGDAKALTNLPEVGKRLAETIIAELKGKVDTFAELEGAIVGGAAGRGVNGISAGMAGGDQIGEAEREAIDALVNLGQSRAEAERNVQRVVAADQSKAGSVEELIRAVFAGR
jgi:Holliday junction DNA helicase RuvA